MLKPAANDSADVVSHIYGYERIDGVVPGIRGQRAFPTRQLETMDPFVMLDQIGPEILPDNFKVEGQLHPHRGFETITFMFEGNMKHQDSLGIEALLNSGSIQVMNAGKGISHGGDMSPDKKTSRFHEVQLWENSPAKFNMSDPAVNTFAPDEIPAIKINNANDEAMQIRVIAGKSMDQTGPAVTFADISVLHIEARGQHSLTLPIPDGHETALLYVLEGESIMIGSIDIAASNTAVLNKDISSVDVNIRNAQFLLLTGKPI